MPDHYDNESMSYYICEGVDNIKVLMTSFDTSNFARTKVKEVRLP